jgi:hypothetical protein
MQNLLAGWHCAQYERRNELTTDNGDAKTNANADVKMLPVVETARWCVLILRTIVCGA